MSHSMKTHKPVALITGAAGGIGKAIAQHLAQKNYRLALTDINQTGLEQMLHELGDEHLMHCINITEREQVRHWVNDVVEKTGVIDVLVNNAGMVITEPFADCTIETVVRENELNYLASLYCVKEVLPHMQKVHRGTIVSIASLAAILPLAASPGYAASKFALRGLMLSLNMALRRDGIHVGCVCPSAVDTPMLQKEAVNGGSALNFLQEPLAPASVAKAVWKVIDKKKWKSAFPVMKESAVRWEAFSLPFYPAFYPGWKDWVKVIEKNTLKRKISNLPKK